MEHIESNTLWRYIIETSNATETAQIQKHLSSCEGCRREHELLRQLESTLQVVDEEVPSIGFSSTVIRKIESEAVFDRKSRFSTKLFHYTVLGSFILAIVAALLAVVGSDLDLSRMESTINGRNVFLIFTAGAVLWGFYFIDRICKKIFVDHNYSESK